MSEFALAHAVGDKTRQAYQRDTMVDQRRSLMVDWANSCALVRYIMKDDPEDWNAVQGKLAASAAVRVDYSLIEKRARAGDSLTQDKLAAILHRNRGLKNKTGRKKPAIDFEMWANLLGCINSSRYKNLPPIACLLK